MTAQRGATRHIRDIDTSIQRSLLENNPKELKYLLQKVVRMTIVTLGTMPHLGRTGV